MNRNSINEMPSKFCQCRAANETQSVFFPVFVRAPRFVFNRQLIKSVFDLSFTLPLVPKLCVQSSNVFLSILSLFSSPFNTI